MSMENRGHELIIIREVSEKAREFRREIRGEKASWLLEPRNVDINVRARLKTEKAKLLACRLPLVARE